MMTRIEQSIEVNVPVSTAYRQLTRFEQYPRFMEDVEEVRQIDDTHLHWHTKAGNLDMEWDAEITEQVPDRCIAWRNTSGPRYEGKIELRPTLDDRTEVKLTMECDPKQQVLAQHGDAQKAIAQRTEHDLARFKKFIEKLSKESHDWLGKIKDAEPLTTDAGAAQPAAKAESGQAGIQIQAPQQQTLGTPAAAQRAGAASARTVEMWPMMMRTAWLPDLLHMWDEPLNLMRRVSEDMERMMARFAGRGGSEQGAGNASAWTPAMEVAQRDGQFVVCAELAGVKREDVSVEVSGDRLTIEGERRQEPLRGQQEFRSTERAYGHFYRVINLPPGADAGAASASLHDGMLEITMPIVQTGQHGRRIAIH